MKTTLRLAMTSLAVLTLAACGDRAPKTGAEPATGDAPTAPSSQTLAQILKADSGQGALAKVAENSGLAGVLDGVGPYTVLAPAEAALKQAGADFTDPAMTAEGAALLRAHIVPGALTRADIAAAVDRSAGKGAQLRTMAGELLTFTRSGEALVATAADGSAVRLVGTEVLASNGALQPIDGLLIKPAAATN